MAVSFKSDESFLRKLAVGAIGTKATIKRVAALGYEPIELERGSTGYKIWKKIKIKRIRVPDILCLRSGQRFESRGKTKLEISMSHSLRDPYRAWDAGMRPDDLVAIVLCQQASESPVDWEVISPIHFVKVEDMREAVAKDHVKVTEPKGVEEGSEIRIIWPCVTANEESVVAEVTHKSIKLISQASGATQRCTLTRKRFSLLPQCQVGEVVQKHQIVASTVPISLSPVRKVEVDEQFFLARLQSASLSERYAAAKALRFRGYQESSAPLKGRMLDEEEDIYVRLEAAAALAAHDDLSGWAFLKQSLNSDYLTIQLETVIVISEIVQPQSEQMLIAVLADPNRDSEVRAGAAWALGEFKTREVTSALVDTFNSTSLEIKTEAARALLKIAPAQIAALIEAFQTIDSSKRDGIAWALARAGGFDIAKLLNDQQDLNLRKWISYIAGYGRSLFAEEQINELRKIDAEVHFAASVLWQLLASWIYGLEEY
ncbi:MAG: hypothetical protein BroJett011_52370 [Chloroflexota bacterium]|nr:MAG: hypothetical protein BroJett011_52370 [Chloroflexota bacterium]